MKHLNISLMVTVLLVAAVTSNAQITITSPTPSTQLVPGSIATIAWRGVSRFDTVQIDYRMSEETDWTLITSTATQLSYQWQIPISLGGSFVLRIQRHSPSTDSTPSLVVLGGGPGMLVNAALWSHDGGRLYSAGQDATVREHDANSGRLLREFVGFVNELPIVITSDDRKMIGYDYQSISVLDLITEQIEKQGYGVSFQRISLTADGKTIMGFVGDSLYLIRTDSLAVYRSLTLPRRTTNAIIAPDGSMIAAIGSDTMLRILSEATGVVLDSVKMPESTLPVSVQFTPDGRFVLVGCRNGSIFVFEEAECRHLITLRGIASSVSMLVMHPTEPYVMGSNGRRDSRIWNITTGEEIHRVDSYGSDLTAFCFSPGSDYLIGTSGSLIRRDGMIAPSHTYTIRGSEVFNGIQTRLNDGLVCEGGKVVASVHEDGAAWFWNRVNGTFAGKSRSIPYNAQDIDASPTSTDVVVASPFEVRILDAEGSLRATYTNNAVRTIGRSMFSGDGENIIVFSDPAYSDSTFVVLSKAGEFRYERAVNNEVISAAASTVNGRYLVTTANSTIRVWDLEDGSLIKSFSHKPFTFTTVLMSPDGATCVVHGNDAMIWLYDVATWTLRDSMNTGATIGASAYSPDSKRIAFTRLGECRVFDLLSKQLLATIAHEYHFSNSNAVQFSTDGRSLAIMNTNVDVYETASWTLAYHLDGKQLMTGIQWFPDEARLLVLAYHHEPWVWDLEPQTEIVEGESSLLNVVSSVADAGTDHITTVVFPQPAVDRLRVYSTIDGEHLSIFDLQSRMISHTIASAESTEVSVASLVPGMYFLHITGKGHTRHVPFVKE